MGEKSVEEKYYELLGVIREEYANMRGVSADTLFEHTSPSAMVVMIARERRAFKSLYDFEMKRKHRPKQLDENMLTSQSMSHADDWGW